MTRGKGWRLPSAGENGGEPLGCLVGHQVPDPVEDLAGRARDQGGQCVGVAAGTAGSHAPCRIATEVAIRRSRRGPRQVPIAADYKVGAQQALTEAMMAESVPARGDAESRALARLRAQGRGYVRFAQAEPGLFRAAFNRGAPTAETSESFALLTEALDGLVASGAMAPARRPGAETWVWATVHGLAELLIEGGPLSRLGKAKRAAEIERTLDFIARALVS